MNAVINLIVLLIVSSISLDLNAISSLAKNDPYPVYSAVWDPFMQTWTKEYLKGCCKDFCLCFEGVALSLSPFHQTADSGRTFGKEPVVLGDLEGRWNMLGMLYGRLPNGASALVSTDNNTPNTGFIISPMISGPNPEPGRFQQLGNAKVRIFSDLIATQNPGLPTTGAINPNILIDDDFNVNYLLTDSTEEIGYFSVPVRYRKVGIRYEVGIHYANDLGLTIQGGVAEIRQTLTNFVDLGADVQAPAPLDQVEQIPDDGQVPENNFFRFIPQLLDSEVAYATCSCEDTMFNPCECTVPYFEIENQLMDDSRARLIFNQIGFDDCNFEKTSLEDVRFIAWWRHIYEINKYRDNCEWPWFLLMPSISFNMIAPVAKEKDRKELFGLPFGNDGHWSFGCDAGISIDFVETVEIAFYAGMNYFLSREIPNYRIPTHISQSGIFPFTRYVRLQPGYNFNCSALLHAYHFLSKLSAWAEWVMVKHETDHITVLNPDPAFTRRLIEQAECITKFTAHVVNAALNYDISPNINLGVLAQFPLAQRNAYRSTTWMATFRVIF